MATKKVVFFKVNNKYFSKVSIYNYRVNVKKYLPMFLTKDLIK